MLKWMQEKVSKSKDGLKDTTKKLSGYEQIEENAKEIKGMAQTVLTPSEHIKNAKKESFNKAMQRLSVNELQLIQNYRNFAYIVYISLTFSLICFLAVLYKLFIVRSIMDAIPVLAIMLFCLANSFKYSFRAFQIKHQRLCSVQEWWNRSGEWIPIIK